jgi:RHH-type proline utilization regulon transcriptional repressor/proline dehydrogenase/delta 1-pyrroline-5-carboxylate dehydrogenase
MAPATAKKLARDIPPLRASYAPPDEAIAAELLASASRRSDAEARIDARATRLVGAIRARTGGLGGVEDFLHAYALSTKEGLALMVLAEALLRVPDAETADRLIEDKLQAGDWAHHGARSAPLLVSASAWTLGLTVKVIHPGETPEGIVDALIKRLGLPAVRAATRQAMRLLGSHFVLGQTIEEALGRASSHRKLLYYSFDMLGEGARTSSRGAPEFPSSFRRCIRATRRCRAIVCLRNSCRICSSWHSSQNVTTSISQSTPKRQIGLSCRSTSSPRHCAMPRWPDGMVSVWRYRPIRSAPGR